MGTLCEEKIDKDKPRWDSTPITYTKLFPKLVEIGHIKPVHLAPLGPHFPDGTMLTLDVTTMSKIQIIPRKIALHSNVRSKV